MRRDTMMMPSVAPSTPAAGDLSIELRELERRLSARIDALQRPATVAPSGAPNVTVIAPTEPGARDTVVLDRYAAPAFQRLQSMRASDLRPYVGAGSRLRRGRSVGVGLRECPVCVRFHRRYLGGTTAVRPYATVGAGVLSPTVLGINTAVGSSFALRSSGARPLFLNVELQGINLFNQTRIPVGLSRSR